MSINHSLRHYVALEVPLAKYPFYQQKPIRDNHMITFRNWQMSFNNRKIINDFSVGAMKDRRLKGIPIEFTSVSGMPANPGMVLPHWCSTRPTPVIIFRCLALFPTIITLVVANVLQCWRGFCPKLKSCWPTHLQTGQTALNLLFRFLDRYIRFR